MFFYVAGLFMTRLSLHSNNATCVQRYHKEINNVFRDVM
jgi:hypothetical protein